MRIPLPEHLAKRVQAAGTPVAEPADAATVVVLRDGQAGLEAYLMRRQSSMAFAPGFYVFPGGGVHDSDWPTGSPMPWIGPGPMVWAQRWRTDPARAHALVVCAIRETFEETGILIAGPDEQSTVADTTELEPIRRALESRELDFADFLNERGWSLRADLLGAWGHWVTPAFEPRRYDTRFFVAAIPAGQTVGEMSGEADLAGWEQIDRVLGDVDSGRADMMPPTVATCRELAQYNAQSIVAVAGARSFETIEPSIVTIDGEMFLQTGSGEGLGS